MPESIILLNEWKSGKKIGFIKFSCQSKHIYINKIFIVYNVVLVGLCLFYFDWLISIESFHILFYDVTASEICFFLQNTHKKEQSFLFWFVDFSIMIFVILCFEFETLIK